MFKVTRSLILALLMIVSIPLIWRWVIEWRNFPPFILPPPELVRDTLIEEKDVFWFHTQATLAIALKGYAVSNLLALTFAVLFVYIKGLENLVKPWAMIVTMVPFPVIAGIFAVTFTEMEIPKITIIVLITFYPILVNLAKGLKAVDPVLLDRMKVLSASKWQIFWKVRWPGALPYYIAAHEISLPGSIIGAIVAEWFFSREGLGFLIIRAQMQYRTDKLFAVALIGLALELIALFLVNLSEWTFLRWRRT